MTVTELIEKLQSFSPDAEVKAIFQGDSPFELVTYPVIVIYELKGHRQCDGVYIEM